MILGVVDRTLGAELFTGVVCNQSTATLSSGTGRQMLDFAVVEGIIGISFLLVIERLLLN